MAEIAFDDFSAVIADVFMLDAVPTQETHLERDLELDSLSLLEIFVALDLNADDQFPDEAFQSIDTVGDFYHFVAASSSRR